MSKKQIGDLQVRLRLRWIEHYEQITKKVAPTCRYFGISRGTFYLWYHRYLSLGEEGLRDKSSRPHKIKRWLPKEVCDTIIQLRLQRKYGPDRMSYYIRQKFNWFVSSQTIWRLYKEHGLNRPSMIAPGIEWCGFTITIPSRAPPTLSTGSKTLCLSPLSRFRPTNGSEFSEAFSWHLEDLGITHRKTKVCSPEANGKVERSHRTDGQEFYGINRFVSVQHLKRLLREWELEYNTERQHMALGGKTPSQYLDEKLKNHVSSRALLTPIKSVQEVC